MQIIVNENAFKALCSQFSEILDAFAIVISSKEGDLSTEKTRSYIQNIAFDSIKLQRLSSDNTLFIEPGVQEVAKLFAKYEKALRHFAEEDQFSFGSAKTAIEDLKMFFDHNCREFLLAARRSEADTLSRDYGLEDVSLERLAYLFPEKQDINFITLIKDQAKLVEKYLPYDILFQKAVEIDADNFDSEGLKLECRSRFSRLVRMHGGSKGLSLITHGQLEANKIRDLANQNQFWSVLAQSIMNDVRDIPEEILIFPAHRISLQSLCTGAQVVAYLPDQLRLFNALSEPFFGRETYPCTLARHFTEVAQKLSRNFLMAQYSFETVMGNIDHLYDRAKGRR